MKIKYIGDSKLFWAEFLTKNKEYEAKMDWNNLPYIINDKGCYLYPGACEKGNFEVVK